MSRSASALPDGTAGPRGPDNRCPHELSLTLWLNPSRYHARQRGNAGRNIVNGPDLAADVSLEKRFVRERAALSVRADVFNVFNRAQIGNPNVKGPTQGTTFERSPRPNDVGHRHRYSPQMQSSATVLAAGRRTDYSALRCAARSSTLYASI